MENNKTEIKRLGDIIGFDAIKKGISENCRSIDCQNIPHFFPGCEAFGVDPQRGYITDDDLGIMQLNDYLEAGATIIDVKGGCCDGAIGYTRLLKPFLQKIRDLKNPSDVYMFCDPSCGSDVVEVMNEEYLEPFLRENDNPEMPSIVLGSYLSRHSGWDCGDARNIEKNLSELEFEDSTLVARSWSHLLIPHKKNGNDTDLEIFKRLLTVS
tara:strand:- start:64 stop:696 length:633 start_codon:yes stop_codon:yes gene_type:complete